MSVIKLLVIGAIVCAILCPILACFNNDAAWASGIMSVVMLLAAGAAGTATP